MSGAAFYMFDPKLTEDVDLDCMEDEIILNMLWETQCYIAENQKFISKAAELLK